MGKHCCVVGCYNNHNNKTRLKSISTRGFRGGCERGQLALYHRIMHTLSAPPPLEQVIAESSCMCFYFHSFVCLFLLKTNVLNVFVTYNSSHNWRVAGINNADPMSSMKRSTRSVRFSFKAPLLLSETFFCISAYIGQADQPVGTALMMRMMMNDEGMGGRTTVTGLTSLLFRTR